ncbi:dihydrolipoyl dehydrogenase family protein [Oceanomicrobium pacificus]|uniref:FAD-dependent oxidoreductase n=1 Tax=Oceanomicrobium pacificus TaxID=2692916 RepID=A0A6B0TZJ7_9RHOB|nr:FAD-dependent oxidoreductase [Oceanomicrobium pacificus]MXU66433.1 FAD-dependent oxidoreductase [Oceanomicrobium pacificus]
MALIETDLCVIGAGSGGLSVAAGAVQMGARVVLIEGGEMGGDCLNTGCVPSKALLAAAKQAHLMGAGAKFGIAPVEPQVDFGAVHDHVHGVIAGIAPHDSQERFEGLGVKVLRGMARFTGDDRVAVEGTEVRARRFVIATGSRAMVPPIDGIADVPYLTNESLFDLTDLPDHLIIVGGGPIGLEMAQAHRRLGAQVTVIEAERALGKDDPDAAALVIERLRAEGITLHEGAGVTSVANVPAGVEVCFGEGQSVTGSHLLLAVGRVPNHDRLDIDKAGIKADRRGIIVDAGLRSSNRRVYAVGDAAGGMQFTHVAGYHAGIVIRSALLGLPAKAKTDHIPWVTYTDPELAQVGLTEAQARDRHGDRVEILTFDYAENDRARAERDTDGFIKVMVYRGRPVGATVVGRQAGEVIQLWALALSAGLKISDVAGMVSPYPTLGELSKRAAGQYYTPRLFDSPLVRRIVQFVQKF